MELNNHLDVSRLIFNTLKVVYQKRMEVFSNTYDENWDCCYVCFLLDKRYVVRYSIFKERGSYKGGVELAIGPNYFTPSQFWSETDGERFTLEATAEGIRYNLALLDEFLGYGKAPDCFNPDEWRS